MKKMNFKIIILILIVAAIGFGAGYYIAGPSKEKEQTSAQLPIESSVDQRIFTCSMHPQIRQNEPGLCPICEMDLIPLEANTSNDPMVLQMTEEAVKLANIQTTVIGDQEIKATNNIRLSGKVQADERLASSQVTHVPGRIEKLYVSFTGEQVYKGQKLADIYSPDLISAQGELLEAIKLKDINPALVEAARNKLSYWKIDASIIESIEKDGEIRELFPIYAEESGIVTKRRVSVGDYINLGEPLFDLMNLRKVWVLFDAYEEILGNVSVGDQIQFTTASIPGREFKSRISFIDPVINPDTRASSLRTEVNNIKGQLKPDMLVYGLLQSKKASHQKISVPKSAVLWTGKRSVVYVKVPDTDIPSFEFREVELGTSMGNDYTILNGLETGEEVVTYGSFVIDAAAQLNNQVSMMNKQVKIKEESSGLAPNFRMETPDSFKNQLHDLALSYISLKDAFVATDGSEAKTAANQLLEWLSEVDMSLLEGEAHMFWMEQLDALKSHTQKIVDLDDIEEQRKQFGFLSDAMILSIDAFGVTGESIFVQYCPMAFDNEGADWLSLEKAIQNPYFGDRMMKCGVVKRELTSLMNDTGKGN